MTKIKIRILALIVLCTVLLGVAVVSASNAPASNTPTDISPNIYDPELQQAVSIDGNVKVLIPYTVKTGDIFPITVTYTNNYEFEASGTYTVEMPAIAALLDDPCVVFDKVAPGASASVNLSALALEGGSEDIRIYRGGKLDITIELIVSGAGYYGGDAHSHSTHSDGADSIAEMAAVARGRGLDWQYFTDHNTVTQASDVADVSTYYAGKFVGVTGNEITKTTFYAYNKTNGHSISYAITSAVPYTNQLTWTETNKLVAQQGGVTYMAHPSDGMTTPNTSVAQANDWRMGNYERYVETGFTGIEIINAHPTSVRSKISEQLWDERNARGDRLYGINNTDTHDASGSGNVYNKGYMTELSRDGINDMLKNGGFYMSNGVDIRFEIDGASMGQTLKITEDAKTSRLHLKAYSFDYPLTSIEVYRLSITGELLGVDTLTTCLKLDLTEQNTYTYEGYFDLELEPNTLYRIKAHTSEHYAISNPIWIEKASATNSATLTGINYSGNGKMLKNAYGNAYIVLDSGSFDAANLSVTASDGATVATEYAEGTDGKAGKLTVKLTAKDGTVRESVFYVASRA